MKILKLSGLFLLSVLFISITSCGSDDVDCTDSATINSDISSQLGVVNAAVTALNNEPDNADLCDDYKKALEDYIEILKDYEPCFDESGQGDAHRDIISESEQNLADAPC